MCLDRKGRPFPRSQRVRKAKKRYPWMRGGSSLVAVDFALDRATWWYRLDEHASDCRWARFWNRQPRRNIKL